MTGFKPFCDLHLHSNNSDGIYSPSKLVELACMKGLSAVSVTDHDTIAGQAEAILAGERFGMDVLTGVEFSTRVSGLDVHILGYLIEIDDKVMQESLEYLAGERIGRAQEMVGGLNKHGIDITMEEVMREAGGGTVGRPHIAMVLLEKGYVKFTQEAFDRWIGFGKPCYVPKTVYPIERVMGMIKAAGGVAAWAHPGIHVRKRKVLDTLCDEGVGGLEVWHPNHSPELVNELERTAGERGLICTGGSDFHSEEAKQVEIGGLRVPIESATSLKKASRLGRPVSGED